MMAPISSPVLFFVGVASDFFVVFLTTTFVDFFFVASTAPSSEAQKSHSKRACSAMDLDKWRFDMVFLIVAYF
jgi:hypothetical protein